MPPVCLRRAEDTMTPLRFRLALLVIPVAAPATAASGLATATSSLPADVPEFVAAAAERVCRRFCGCPQPIDATVRQNTSDGFIQFKVCRGRLLSSLATAFRCAA